MSIVANERRAAASLRNWLVLGLVLDVLVIWGFTELNQSDREILAIWIGLWFCWQLLFWGVWLVHCRKTATREYGA
jgi:hypothetical protein